MAFGCGCALTFAGVKLLTGNKQRDRQHSMSGLAGSPAAAPQQLMLGDGYGDGTLDDKRTPFLAGVEREHSDSVSAAPAPGHVSGHIRSSSYSDRPGGSSGWLGGGGLGGGGGSSSGLGGGGSGQLSGEDGGSLPYPPPPGIQPGFDEEYEQLQPIQAINSPLAVSGDVLRRTFSTRLSAFAERAAQLGGMRSRDSPVSSSF